MTYDIFALPHSPYAAAFLEDLDRDAAAQVMELDPNGLEGTVHEYGRCDVMEYVAVAHGDRPENYPGPEA